MLYGNHINSSESAEQPTPQEGLGLMDTAMEFELTMRLLFGEKAYHIADFEANPSGRREWLQKSIRKLTRVVNDLDTTHRHKQRLMADLDTISKLLKGIKEPSWDLVYRFLRLVSRLLGYDYVRGAKCHSLLYWQSPEQHLTSHVLSGGDIMQNYYDRKDAISVRRAVVEDLKSKGLDDFKISLVLNTTEYEVKQLRSNPAF